MAFFLRILARGRLGIGPAGHTVEYEQDYGKGVTLSRMDSQALSS